MNLKYDDLVFCIRALNLHKAHLSPGPEYDRIHDLTTRIDLNLTVMANMGVDTLEN